MHYCLHKLLVLVWLAGLLAGPAFSLPGQSGPDVLSDPPGQPPQAGVSLTLGAEQQAAGVYLGQGLILTSAQAISGEQFLWDVATSAAPTAGQVLFNYLADDELAIWEEPTRLHLCPLDGTSGYQATWQAPRDTDTHRPAPVCFPYTSLPGMRVAPLQDKSGTPGVPVAQLLYLNRGQDIALLSVDGAALEAAFPDLDAARLDARPLSTGQPLTAPGVPAPYHLSAATPRQLTYPQHMAGHPLAHRLAVLPLTGPQTGPDLAGQGLYHEAGLAGLYWATGADDKTAAQVPYLNPASRWAHDLWAVQAQLGHAGLRTVLADARWPEAVQATDDIGDPVATGLGNAGIDVLHYDLQLDIDPTAVTLAGRASLTVRPTRHNLARFSLDLHETMTVEGVTVAGQPVTYQHAQQKLTITLPEPVAYGQSFTVTITYHGQPQPLRTRFSRYFSVGLEHDANLASLAFVNQPDGAHTWFPANDHPRDRATFRFEVGVPDGLEAVANGTPYSVDNGRFSWVMPYPMATYLATVAVGDYVLIEDDRLPEVALRHYVYAGTEDEVAPLLDRTPAILMALEAHFGPYPYASYGHVVTPLRTGALETQTMTVLPRSITQADGEAQLFTLLVHELAHQWYGNAVALASWQDIWLNEGLATYAEWLALDTRYQRDESRGPRTMAERRLGRTSRQTPLAAPQPHELFEFDSYQKGAWVFYMLRQELGDAAFFQVLRAWAAAYRTRPVTTLDFLQLTEIVTRRDLTAFWQRWLYTAPLPAPALVWQADEAGLAVQVCGTSKNADGLRLTVAVQAVDGRQQQQVVVDLSQGGVQRFDLPFTPQRLTVDPDQHLLEAVSARQVTDTPHCGGLEEALDDY